MRYSKTAIKELNAKYRAVLKKMFLMNAAILLTISMAAPANATVVPISNGQTFENLTNNEKNNQNAAGLTLSFGDTLSQDGVSDVKFTNNSSVNSGGAMKALNGFTAGDNWEFDGNHSDKISGGLYIKIPNSGSENRNVTFGNGTTFSNNTSKWLGGALGIEAAGTVTLGDNTTFDTNHSDADGGAIAVWTDGTNTDVTTGTTLNLGKTNFTGNTATNRGGALANLNNDTQLTPYSNTVNIGAGSSFTNNSAAQGGAIYNKGIMTISGATFEGNTASAEGGAIMVRGNDVYQSDGDMAVMNINNSTFTNNTATGKDALGGAISASRNSNVTITNSTFDSNKALQGYAGAIWSNSPNADGTMKGGILTITNTSFTNNEALGIGAVGLYSKSVLKNVTFEGNKATSSTDDGGGAVFMGSSSTSIIDGATFTKNSSAAAGGAIATRDNIQGNQAGATLDISNATFTENTAGTKGGAIYNTFYNNAAGEGHVSVLNTAFDKNSAQNGGAIYNDGTGDKVVAGQPQGFANMELTDTTFTGNSASILGGAIYNTGTMTLNGLVSFGALDADGNAVQGNTAGAKGGAIYTDGTLTIGDNALFAGNTATSGAGALYSGYHRDNTASKTTPDAITTTIGNNVRFIGNSITAGNDSSGGAIGNHTNSTMTIGDNALFKGNSATVAGGAVSNSYNVSIENSTADATLNIGNGAQFIGNTADKYGGAIHNEQKMTIGANAVFQSNTATTDRGGAIANAGWDGISAILNIGDNALFGGDTADLGNTSINGGAIYNKLGASSDTSIVNLGNGVQFKNNVATTGDGGAIYNGSGAEINFAGDATFANNTANGSKNDIYNDGTLDFNGGTVTLDGGITGNGTVSFADGTNLKTALLADASTNAIITANTINGNINLVMENGSNGGQVKFDASNNNLTVANNNALYNIEGNNGLFNVTKKSSSEVAAATGAAQHHADAVVALTKGTCNNEGFNALSNAVNELVQSSDPNAVALGVKAAATLAPSTVHIANTHTTQNVNQIFSAVSSRLSSGSISSMGGQSSGDEILGNGALWAKALYNKSKLSTQDGFDAYSRGLALGAEGHIHDQVKIGIGYAYTSSDIKPTDKKNEIDSNTAILYGEYKPSDWFVNAIASYTWGRNDDHRYVLGNDINAKYDVNSFSAQIQTGYDFNIQNYTITPEIGLRYVNVDQKGFTDSIGNYTNGNKSDVFTGIVGATASAEYVINADLSLKPEIRLAAKYDFVNDDVASVMTLANGAVVSSQGKSLKKLSGEVGLGLTANVSDTVELGISYQGEFRKHYADNTGMITAKYNF